MKKENVMNRKMYRGLVVVLLAGCFTANTSKTKLSFDETPLEGEQQVQREPKWDAAPFQLAYKCGKISAGEKLVEECQYLAENWLKGWVIPETKGESQEWISEEDVQVIQSRCEGFWKSKTPFNSWCHQRVLLVSWLCGETESDAPSERTQEKRKKCKDFVNGLELK